MTKVNTQQLQDRIELLSRTLPPTLGQEDHAILESILEKLDTGQLRVVTQEKHRWIVHTWLKQAILLNLRYKAAYLMEEPTFGFDKIPSKFSGWTEESFINHGIRLVPGALARRGAFIGHNTILMQSFVNIGAQVEAGTLIDTWALVGSCAYVGKRCHISAGVIIGGVLEPLQAMPVIIEDNCFIGAQSVITEGVIVEEGSVLGMGVQLSGSTPIINRATQEVTYGRIPAGSVVIPGMMARDALFLPAAVIIKQVDEQTRQKTAINALLRLS